MAMFLLVVVLFFTMGRFGKAIARTIKKIMGSSSKCSHGSSSSCYTNHEESPMQKMKKPCRRKSKRNNKRNGKDN